jgi:hypothetical protein
MVAMGFFMLFYARNSLLWCKLVVLVGMSTGCAQREPSYIINARIVQDDLPTLEVRMFAAFTTTMLDALDHGVVLVLRFDLSSDEPDRKHQEIRHLELRYMPLIEQYQLKDREFNTVRNFSRRGLLLANLDHVRLPLSIEWKKLTPVRRLSLTYELDIDALPGPLRLPAQWNTQWQLHAPQWQWTELN